MTHRSEPGHVRLPGWASRAVLLIAVLVLGLAMAPVAQGATITKVASATHVNPLETVTYTLTIHATKDSLVTVTDRLPFGVVYGGNLSPPEANYMDGLVTWSGAMKTGETTVIGFDVVVGDWETVGPLPIVNKACANDGTEICSSVAIFLSWYRLYMPVSMRSVVWGDYVPPWLGE
jgi:hypothetical protein